MKNIIVTFTFLYPRENTLIGYSKLGVYMIFNMKVDLIRKAQLVADGHLTPDPVDNTYAGAVSRETVWIALPHAVLLDLEMKSSGRDFRDHLSDCMDYMRYKSCLTDPDLWMRPTKLDNCIEYYEYILLYVDDCLFVREYPDHVLNQLRKYFPMNPESVGPRKLYLDGKLSTDDLPHGFKAWDSSASNYIQTALKNIEANLKQYGLSLMRGTNYYFSGNY